MQRSRFVLSIATSAAVAFAPAWAAADRALQPLTVKVGQAPDLTHIEFGDATPVVIKTPGAGVTLRFARAPSAELVQLKVNPPALVRSAVVTPRKGGVELHIEPAEGAVLKTGRADGASYLNLSPKADVAAAPVDQPAQRRADPTPSSGVVCVAPDLQGKAVVLRFAWRAPVGAAVFRRGDYIWMVFDAKARLDLGAMPRGLPQFRRAEPVEGADFTAVRFLAPPATLAAADAEGATWSLTLAPSASSAPQAIPLKRDDATGPAAIDAQMPGSTGVFWVTDPAIGDKLAVVTALAPSKGLDQRRALVDAVLLPTVQGLAIQPLSDDLSVHADGDIVRISRPHGLAISGATAPLRRIAAAPELALPTASSMPGLVEFAAWSRTGEGGFVRRYQQLLDAAASEGAKGKAGGVQARLGLARFLLGSELPQETIGVLGQLTKANPAMLGDPEVRALRGVARAMAGRFKDAQADFSAPVLADDPASALWRGYVDVKLGDFAGGREQMSHGRSALYQFAPTWKARFAAAEAEAELSLNDIAGARSSISIAAGERVAADDADMVRLLQGRIAEASGRADEALALYDAAARSTYGAVAAPAILHATQLRLAQGKLKPDDAVATLNSLRFLWRGDATELESVRTLGRIYLSQGRYREALYALRSAGQLTPDQPGALAVSNDLSAAFRALFLDGQADGLQPIQALGLFNDFKNLTPIGADGDLMVRKLVRRLIDVDLLDQAADLLRYQVENRLSGVPKAQVATDLATIELMAKKPEQALAAINESRSTLLPTALNGQRRLVEARALMALGRGDHALELLEGDKGPEAAEVRAEAAWGQHDWAKAGAMLEALLGDRWKRSDPLGSDDLGRLMRAGVAYSLSGDEAALARLRSRYMKLAEGSSAPDALRIALAGVDATTPAPSDFARVASDAAAFSGWVSDMKRRFHDRLSADMAASLKPAPGAALKPDPHKA